VPNNSLHTKKKLSANLRPERRLKSSVNPPSADKSVSKKSVKSEVTTIGTARMITDSSLFQFISQGRAELLGELACGKLVGVIV
jgi:hypothetical protein